MTSLTTKYKAFAFEKISISSGAVTTLTAATFAGAYAARIYIEGGDIRYTLDGSTTPVAATTGDVAVATGGVWLGSPDDIQNFKCVRETAVTVTLHIHYFRLQS